ncbi:hypothetical protein [Streptosporangium sp. KLBMP 9127]|nr:hypothetical protein [Streptosporangium sp. KLBMP 9127]
MIVICAFTAYIRPWARCDPDWPIPVPVAHRAVYAKRRLHPWLRAAVPGRMAIEPFFAEVMGKTNWIVTSLPSS